MVESQQPIDSAPEIDEEGFLVRTETWNRDIAKTLAQGEVKGGLTEDHWQVVDYLRQYYLEFKNIPPDRMIAKGSGVDLERINELFPSGVIAGACKIAGVPREAICGKRYQCKRS